MLKVFRTHLIKLLQMGTIHDCHISPSTPIIIHLLFTDDNFLFFKENTEEIVIVITLLNTYEIQLGQLVNFQKSCA